MKKDKAQRRESRVSSDPAEGDILRQSGFLKTVLDSLTYPFYVIDANDYTVKMANSAANLGDMAGELTCYALTHESSKPCSAADHPCPLEIVKRTKKSATVEHVHFDTDGDARNVEVHAFPIFDSEGKVGQVIEYMLDITKRRQAERHQLLAEKLLECLNRKGRGLDVIRDILELVKEFTEFDAVGIRLEKDRDYPYFEVRGFPEDFVEAENYLCARDQAGELIHDSSGQPLLECMCGNIISGRTDPSLPFFTKGGSFWTNCTTELLASTPQEDLQVPTRNRCNQNGYESVALIPLRSGHAIVGLLQLNDRRRDCFTPKMIRFFEEIGASIGIALERIKAEQDIENLAKFPSENPFPVLRIARDGTILYANSAASGFLEHWGRQVGKSAPPDWCELIAEVLESGRHRIRQVEWEGRILSFMATPVAEAGYVNIYGRDITRRRQSEEALRRSEQRYSLAQRAANIGSWDWNILTGELVWSEQIEPMFGFAEGKFDGTYQTFLNCIHPQDRQFVIDSVEACIEHGEDYAIEHRIVWPDGTVRWVSETGDVVRDEHGKATRMVGIVQDFTRRKKAEEEIRKLNQQLEQRVAERTVELTQANKELRQEFKRRRRLEKEILDISEREQRRIGQELHDSIGQQLTGIAIMSKVLERKLAGKSQTESADAREITELVNEAVKQARGLAKGLHPVDLDRGGLMSSLQELAATTEQLFGVRCTFKCDRPVPIDDTTAAAHLYRIAQEAVTNAIKHGEAENVIISLGSRRDMAVLSVENDGSGFPDAPPKSKGMGLKIMGHRAEMIDGSLEVRRGTEGGTIVICAFPNKKHREDGKQDYGRQKRTGKSRPRQEEDSCS